MPYREKMPKSIDSDVFHNTAVRTRKINIGPRVQRGGTRL